MPTRANRAMEPFPISVTDYEGTLRIEWSNRLVPKQNGEFGCLMIVWLFIVPMTAMPTWFFLFGPGPILSGKRLFFGFWFAIGWIITVYLPYDFLGRWQSERIEVTRTTLSHTRRGFLAPKAKTYILERGTELCFGRYYDGVEHDSRVTLQIVWLGLLGGRLRDRLGRWLADPAKERVFLAIKQFVETHQIPLTIKRFES